MFKNFNWGHGVALVLGIFMIFIITFVYKTIARPEYDHQLVSEEYYKDEMVYQQELDRLQNAKSLKEGIQLITLSEGIQIVFPDFLVSSAISGTVNFQRPENKKWDFNLPIQVEQNKMLIPSEQLKKGTYNVKIIWQYDQISYQVNEKLNFK